MSENKQIFTDGLSLISSERKRQILDEDFSYEHDDKLAYGELSSAAICYAAPFKIYKIKQHKNSFTIIDPFPWTGGIGDKRLDYGGETIVNSLPEPGGYTDLQKLDLLTKAGALISAEIDKLLRSRGEHVSNKPG